METTALETAAVTASQSGAVPVEETVWVVEPVAMAVGAAVEAVMGEPAPK
jgi:hypothetical protein